MPIQFLALFLILLSTHSSSEDFDTEKFERDYQQRLEKALDDNSNLTEEQITDFFRRIMKYDQENWSEFQSYTKSEREKFIDNSLSYYSAAGLSILEMLKMFDQSPDFEEMMSQIWFGDNVVADYAMQTLNTLSKKEYKLIIEVAKKMIDENSHKLNYRGFNSFLEGFPKELDFIRVDQIRVYEDYCEVYLYKGMDSMRTIGYQVIIEEGDWVIYSLNYMQSLKKTKIELD